MGRTLYRRKGIVDNVRLDENRITNLEIQTTDAPAVVPGTTTSDLAFQFQATSFSKVVDQGDARVYPTTATSSIDEETNAAVAAYATFDDVGGNGAASTSPFDGNYRQVPLLEVKGKTAFYHVHPSFYDTWVQAHPEVVHTKQFMVGNAVKLNVPGTAPNDAGALVYYASNAAFNVSVNFSLSFWFYPTDTSNPGNPLRYLFYRYIDASNYYYCAIDTSDAVHNRIKLTINEGGLITRLRSSGNEPVDNFWNNMIVTYDATANTPSLYINNNLSTVTSTTVINPIYTTDTNLFLGGVPQNPNNRYTGYMDNFVFWTNKILTTTEVSNMWNHGTIV
jgi:Concanavalin A-like lectin/glucanases superfamily